jgi:hypothetical protein
LSEELELQIGDWKEEYTWAYVVEIISGSIADTRCSDWLCQKANVKTENLKPGETTGTRETMFLHSSGNHLLWKQFIDSIIAPDGAAAFKITLRSRIVVADGSKRDISREVECRVDVSGARQSMIAVGYEPGRDPRPPTWQPRCLQK